MESSWQLSVASAHAGAIDLMSGKPAETAENFERQLKEARKASTYHIVTKVSDDFVAIVFFYWRSGNVM